MTSTRRRVMNIHWLYAECIYAYVHNKRSTNNDIYALSNRQSIPKQFLILVCEHTPDFYQGKHFTFYFFLQTSTCTGPWAFTHIINGLIDI